MSPRVRTRFGRFPLKKYLFDIQQAARRLAEFTRGREFDAYVADAMLRAAVEPQFELIGEALVHLRKVDPKLCDGVSDASRIIALAIGRPSPQCISGFFEIRTLIRSVPQ
jgi:hypothetical protein